MTDCLFCQIIAGERSAHVVLDTPAAVGFLDIRPVFKGHTLVVPRAHHVTLPDLPTDELTGYFTQVQRMATAMVAGLGAHGSFVAVNNVVSQSVAHLHTHVVPRTKGDGLKGFFWPRTRYADGEAESFTARLRKVLDDAAS